MAPKKQKMSFFIILNPLREKLTKKKLCNLNNHVFSISRPFLFIWSIFGFKHIFDCAIRSPQCPKERTNHCFRQKMNDQSIIFLYVGDRDLKFQHSFTELTYKSTKDDFILRNIFLKKG